MKASEIFDCRKIRFNKGLPADVKFIECSMDNNNDDITIKFRHNTSIHTAFIDKYNFSLAFISWLKNCEIKRLTIKIIDNRFIKVICIRMVNNVINNLKDNDNNRD